MKHTILCRWSAALTLLAVAGCNSMGGQPQFKEATITPATLKPGETALIMVKVQDKNQIIDRIEGVVREDPRITLPLLDNGQDPDEKAGDGIWSLRVDVPRLAPAGDFQVEFTAYRGDGQAVPIRDKGGDTAPLMQNMQLSIRYEQPPAPQS